MSHFREGFVVSIKAVFLVLFLLSGAQAEEAPLVDPAFEEASAVPQDPWDIEDGAHADDYWDWDPTVEQFDVQDPGAAARGFALHLTAGGRWNRDMSVHGGEGPGGVAGPARHGREVYALATLQVPFEMLAAAPGQKVRSRILARNEAAASSPEADPGEADGKLGGESSDEGVKAIRDSAAPASTAEPAAPTSFSSTDNDEPAEAHARVDSRGYLRLARELAARVTTGRETGDRRLRSLTRRSRWSGLVPELRLRGVLGFDRTTSMEDATGIYPGETTVRGGSDSLAEARLTFHLDRLVLGDGEASLERQREQRDEGHRKRVTEALDLLVAWRIATARADDQTLLPEERVDHELEAEAALVHLHLLTGGWFRGRETLELLDIELTPASPPSDEGLGIPEPAE